MLVEISWKGTFGKQECFWRHANWNWKAKSWKSQNLGFSPLCYLAAGRPSCSFAGCAAQTQQQTPRLFILTHSFGFAETPDKYFLLEQSRIIWTSDSFTQVRCHIWGNSNFSRRSVTQGGAHIHSAHFFRWSGWPSYSWYLSDSITSLYLVTSSMPPSLNIQIFHKHTNDPLARMQLTSD